MLSDITLGQYFTGNSLLHRLDPRMKVILSILYIVAIFSAKFVLCYGLLLLMTAFLIAVGGVPFRTLLKGLKPIVFIVILTAIINLFSSRGETLLFSVTVIPSVWTVNLYLEGIYRAVFMSLRVILLILGTGLFLTYTTSPIALTDAIESLLYPLSLMKVPVHEFAMMMTIALRFIPTLIEETEKIMNAQKARGADLSTGGLIRRIRALIPILIPLFISAFQRALDLATAMECRCYRGGKGRTKMRRMHTAPRDFVMLSVFLLFLTAIYLGNYFLPKILTWGFSV